MRTGHTVPDIDSLCDAAGNGGAVSCIDKTTAKTTGKTV